VVAAEVKRALTALTGGDASLETLHPPARDLPEPNLRSCGDDAPSCCFHECLTLLTSCLELVADGAKPRSAVEHEADCVLAVSLPIDAALHPHPTLR